MPCATVHIADVGPATAVRLLARSVPRTIPGLRRADLAICAPFGPGLVRLPQPGRVALFAFWDDDDAVDDFLTGHPIAHALADGWRTRLEPLRVHGSWPGLPTDLPRTRSLGHAGPFVVLTLGRLHPTQTIRFFRVNAVAEKGVLDAPGNIWATAAARPPFVATCSLWESEESIAGYAYAAGSGHNDAIGEQARKSFHQMSAFVRFRPYRSEGAIDGRNLLAGV